MKSSLSIAVHELDTQFKKLGVPVDKNDWEEHANVARVGAYYMILENSICKLHTGKNNFFYFFFLLSLTGWNITRCNVQ